MKSTGIKISEDVKFLLKPISFLAIIIILFGITISVGTKSIKGQNNNLKTLEATDAILVKKVEVLRNVGDFSQYGLENIEVIVPSENAILYAMSQVKILAQERGVLLDNIRSGGRLDTKGVSKINFSFNAYSDQANLHNFLDSISYSLPLMSIDKVKITTEADTMLANVSMSVYSAQLPKKLPSLTTAVSALSESEVQLLYDLGTYHQVQFQTFNPIEQGAREDIFN